MTAEASPLPPIRYLACKKCGKRKPLAFFAKAGFYRLCVTCMTRLMNRGRLMFEPKTDAEVMSIAREYRYCTGRPLVIVKVPISTMKGLEIAEVEFLSHNEIVVRRNVSFTSLA